MDEWWRSESISFSLSHGFCFLLFFSLFIFFFLFLTLIFSPLSQSPSLSLLLLLSSYHLSPHSLKSLPLSLSLSPGVFSSWPSDTSSWCHFNNLRGEIGNVVSSQNWNGFFTASCWYSGGRIRGKLLPEYFSSSWRSASFSANEEKWCDAKFFAFWPRNLIFLTRVGSFTGQSNLSLHLDWEV